MMEEPKPQGIDKYLGGSLISADGESIGAIDRFIPNRVTEVPAWYVVEAGFLGSRTLVVPMAGSTFDGNGQVIVPYPKQMIEEAPAVEVGEVLDAADEDALNEHYDLGAPEGPSTP